MNILFISHLSHSLSTGPAWSVPARVKAQTKLDNVMWINTSPYDQEHWKQVKAYHNLREFGKTSFRVLPQPFDRPDVVIFEGFYGGVEEIRFAVQCWKAKIPYIIVPRGSLTHQAMNNHSRVKKQVCHSIFYNRFIKKSTSIQFLTQQECADSFDFNCCNHFIMPNGINMPPESRCDFLTDGVRATFIGRIDCYHKGIDLLLSVVAEKANKLRKIKFSLVLYGPKSKDCDLIEKMIFDYKISDIVKLQDQVLGDAKRDVLMSSDLFVLTSRFEGHPMGLLEALSYGVPCLITDGTNMRKEVENADAGWVSNFSKEGLSSTLDSLVDQLSLLPIKGTNARKLAENYKWDGLAIRFHNCIEDLLLN